MSSKLWTLFGVLVSLCVLTFSLYLAIFPGEWMDENLPRSPLQALLFEGGVDFRGRPRSIFSNRLVLSGQSMVDPEKLDKIAVSRSVRGRDLRLAVLIAADLRKVDFAGAQLQDASFDFAQLQGAMLNGARLLAASLSGAHLQGASLNYAQSQGASFNSAQLQGATLDSAQLQGATLDSAQLQGADLSNATIWRARANTKPNLYLADLQNIDAVTKLVMEQQSFADWRDEIAKNIPASWRNTEISRVMSLFPGNQRKDRMMSRLAALDPAVQE